MTEDIRWDYEQLAKKAKETGTVLEVNNGSLRPGGFRVDTRKNDLKMLEYCKKYEVPDYDGKRRTYGCRSCRLQLCASGDRGESFSGRTDR